MRKTPSFYDFFLIGVNKYIIAIKFEFSVGTRYINSTVRDVVELQFDDDATEEEIEKEVEENWCEWRAEQCDGGWKRID